MTIHEVLKAARATKEAGFSKVPLPINVVEQLCEKALKWDHTPALMREAIKKMEGEPCQRT